MADNFYDATGVLVLDKVTPVITALFGDFSLDERYPGNGEVYIARMSECADPQWDDIEENLEKLCDELGLSLPDGADDSVKEYLYVLASHFGADQDVELLHLIEHSDFDDNADLSVLFDIARRFNDGHGLRAMKIEGCWHCSKPRLFEFGGQGEFHGRHIAVTGSSTTPLQLGEEVDNALEAGDLNNAAESVLKQINKLLAGVSNASFRETLRSKIGASLMASTTPWFAVTGRIPGDDEDTCHVFQVHSHDEAVKAFETAMYEGEREEVREIVWNAHGQYVFITSVMTSATPITFL